MDALIASLPILMVVVAMLVFGLPAKVALPIGWLATLVVALGYWGQDMLTAAAWAADGFLESISTLAIVFGAILVAARLDWFGLKGLLTSSACTFRIDRIFGCEAVGWKWNWGWNPGVLPFAFVCVLTFALLRMPLAKVGEVCATTGVAGNEGRIIRINLVPCLVYCAIVVLVLGFLA